MEIAKSVLKIDSLTLDSTQEEIDSWDSLAHIRLIMEVEKEFNISIPIDDIARIKSLKDFLNYLG